MAAAGQFEDIKMGAFSFLDHSNPKYNEVGAPTQLDNLFSETFGEGDWNELFVDDTRDEVKNNVIDLLRARLIAIVAAGVVGDHARIPPLVNNWAFKYEWKEGKYKNLKGRGDFIRALNIAMRDGLDELNIYVVWNGTCLNLVNDTMDYANFDNYADAPFAPPPPPPGHGGAAGGPGGVAAAAAALGLGPIGPLAGVYLAQFKPDLLPVRTTDPITGTVYTSVKSRYDQFYDIAHHMRGRSMTPFNNTGVKLKYFLDPHTGNTYVLRNGMAYRPNAHPDWKECGRRFPKCTATHAPGIYAWHKRVTKHLHQFGIYCHPFELNQKGGGSRGFIIADGSSGDLPKIFAAFIDDSEYPLWSLLADEKTFPKGSSLHDTVTKYDGRGYEALHAIVKKAHPRFSEHPGLMIANPPIQYNEQSLADYFMMWKFYLDMSALINNVAQSLDNPTTMDVFIEGTLDSKFFFQVSREDRKSKQGDEAFKTSGIVDTLLEYQQLPEYKPTKGPSRDAAEKEAGYYKIHQMVAEAFEESRGHPDYLTPAKIAASQSDDSEDTTEASVNLLSHESLPFDMFNPRVDCTPEDYYKYFAAINAIAKDHLKANATTCIICGGTHTFDGCPVLADSEFLRDHYIKFTTWLKRDILARKKKGHGVLPILEELLKESTKDAKTNSVAFDEVKETSPVPDAPGQDFYHGQK